MKRVLVALISIAAMALAAYVYLRPGADKKLTLSLCKELDANGCIPPLIQGTVQYFFPRANTRRRLGDYLNDVYFAGDTLAFAFTNTDKRIKAFYTFPDGKEKFPMERVDHANYLVSGFSLVGSIAEKYHRNHLAGRYRPLVPLEVRYEFYEKDKLLASRTVLITLQ